MKKKVFLFIPLVWAVIISGCESTEVPANEEGGQEFALTEGAGIRKIAIIRPDVTLNAAADAVRIDGGSVRHHLDIIHALAVALPDAAAETLLAGNPAILRLEDDPVAYAIGKPAPAPPPAQTTPYGIEMVGAPEAWSSTVGAGARVAVVDTGISLSHPDLLVSGGANFVASATSYNDDNGHGSHVAGTIGAVNNSIGVVGAASQASLYAVKVLDRRGSGYYSGVIAGINWAVLNGMDVVNMSLGGTADSQALHDACDAAVAAGLLLVAAAGNSGDGNPATNNLVYPARYGSVIAVAAIDSSKTIAYFSSDGENVELSAPGVSVYSTYKGSDYATLSGTSMATPHVSGVAALAISTDPSISPSCLRTLLAQSAEDLGASGRDVFYGYGLVSAPGVIALLPAGCI